MLVYFLLYLSAAGFDTNLVRSIVTFINQSTCKNFYKSRKFSQTNICDLLLARRDKWQKKLISNTVQSIMSMADLEGEPIEPFNIIILHRIKMLINVQI